MGNEGVKVHFKLIKETEDERYMEREGELTRNGAVALIKEVVEGNYELCLKSAKGTANFELTLNFNNLRKKSNKDPALLLAHWSCFVGEEKKDDSLLASQHCIMY